MVKAMKEAWNSRLGVILAVSGSAVGLGNFLRFPGQAAEFGGGAFMIAYFISFLLLGLPICWAEWTMGRRGGQMGFNSSPAIFTAITKHPAGAYLGILGVVVPVIIYTYYVNIEAWCLGYAMNFLRDGLSAVDARAMNFADPSDSTGWWATFIGAGADGSAFAFGFDQVGTYLLICFFLNFLLIYRGLSKGIEWFCKLAMPTLLVLGIIILIRVLTLGTPDAQHPERNLNNGLGFMWNPSKVYVIEQTENPKTGEMEWLRVEELVGKESIAAATAAVAGDALRDVQKVSLWQQLLNPKMWLAAAGQIFFSLSVGFGVIITYSSYMKRDDDVVLSGLAATSANEFAEVGLGGLITLPAAVAFLGVAGVAAAGIGTFDLGFKVLPMVFAQMGIFGPWIGFLFFFLLFLAAVTSSLSMLQPGIAFLEDTLGINRRQSVAILGLITGLGATFVVWFSGEVKALDTLDFWAGTFLIYVLAMIQIIIFGWVLGIEKGFESAHEGSIIRIPDVFKIIMKYVAPLFLMTIFITWFLFSVLGIGTGEPNDYIVDLFSQPNKVAIMAVCFIIGFGLFGLLLLWGAPKYRQLAKAAKKELS